MKKKKILISILTVAILALSLLGIYQIFYKKDENNLTSADRQWLEKNKNDVIDISIINNMPIFNYNGEGVLFDLVDDISKETGLDFNKLPYNLGDNIDSNLGLILVDKLNKDDITIYKDNYVILTKKRTVYNNIDDIPNLNIGVAKQDLESARYYLKANGNISYKEYGNYSELLNAIKKENSNIEGIILPKITYFKEIVEDENLNIAYNISDMYKSLVFRIGENQKLNKILSKYINKWYEKEYQRKFNEHFTSNYFAFKGISEQERTNFKTGKTYTYGLVSYAPYTSIVNKKIVGINYEIIKDFANLNDIEIKWKEYKNNKELIKDFNENKIDFFLDTTSTLEYKVNITTSSTTLDSDIAVLCKNCDYTIKSLASLKDKNVVTIKDSKIEESLLTYDIKPKTYDRVSKLLRNKKSNDVVVIDYSTYEIYKDRYFKNYKVNYLYKLNNDYKFISNNSDENKVFNSYFIFYLSFIELNNFKNIVNINDFKPNLAVKIGPIIALIILILLVILLINNIKNKYAHKEKIVTISREDKIKYIDVLTSLKNRAYLNDSIEKWDESEVYPQAIVIVDLNNVAYINDNYGHQEGDNLIKEAAAILVNNQIENTEIMRTSGNEFLVYMVDYDEKQVVTYIRKLARDFKDLSHGFGAAIGYSMITDAIKTIDDAINEATLDMKNNKEESQN